MIIDHKAHDSLKPTSVWLSGLDSEMLKPYQAHKPVSTYLVSYYFFFYNTFSQSYLGSTLPTT